MRLAPENHLQKCKDTIYFKTKYCFLLKAVSPAAPFHYHWLWHKSVLSRSGTRNPVTQTLHNLHFRLSK